MKIAIMQPYFFPYIGYFQLINSVDFFVVYDDVNFIKRGWINRNNILVNNSSFLFCIPLQNSSQNKLINEISIIELNKWKLDFLKTIIINYKKSPFFEQVYPLIEKIVKNEESNLSRFIVFSLKEINNYLSIKTDILISSEIEKNNILKGQDKIIEICKKLGATNYINPNGGIDLYDKEIFNNNNIILNFIQSKNVNYCQFENDFLPWLSIIDVMMFNSPSQIQIILEQYNLL